MNQLSKVAIVTGAGKRLGRAIAIALARNGYDLSLSYNSSRKGCINTANAIKKIGKSVLITKTDISKKRQVDNLIHNTIKKYGRVDLLVNNSGIFKKGTLLSINEKLWDSTIDINLKGVFLCSQAVAPFMIKQKRGKIINIASIGGLQPWTNYLPYCVSKAGVLMLTKILAKTLAPNIHVNAIAPGFIQLNNHEKSRYKDLKRKTLLKRWGRATDITDMVIYLAEVENYITGQVFVIDGGKLLD